MAKKFQIFDNNRASHTRLDSQAKQIIRNAVANSESWLSVINNLEDIKRNFESEIKTIDTNNNVMPQFSYKSEFKDNTLQIWKINAYGDKKYLLISVGTIENN